MTDLIQRCAWCSDDPVYIAYHDQEWGHPLYDEHALFELLCLEGQQAGLSWITVLKKRPCYRTYFFQYSIDDIAQMTDQYIEKQRLNKGLIRHRLKLYAIRHNARAWKHLKQTHPDVSVWLWSFVNQKTQINDVPHSKNLTPSTPMSIELSQQLKKYGFKFVGPTICYAFMQAAGMVNDHENSCSFKSLRYK